MLAAALVLSVISLAQVIGDNGVQIDSGIEVVSCALTAMGLYYSFTGDARGLVQRVMSSVDSGCVDGQTRNSASGFDATHRPGMTVVSTLRCPPEIL